MGNSFCKAKSLSWISKAKTAIFLPFFSPAIAMAFPSASKIGAAHVGTIKDFAFSMSKVKVSAKVRLPYPCVVTCSVICFCAPKGTIVLSFGGFQNM